MIAETRAGQREQQITALRALGRCAEDVQPVANLQVLEIAQEAVKLAQNGCIAVLSAEPQIVGQPEVVDLVDDILGQQRRPGGVQPSGLKILVYVGFQRRQVAVQAGAGQRRGQVVDDHGGRAPLGLRPLPGVIDDEGVELRHGAEHRVGEAAAGQRQRLARQPFEVAVLADVDDGVGLRPHGGVEGEIPVWRHQIGVVVGAFDIEVVAALRLDADQHLAEAVQGEVEACAVPERILRRFTPARLNGGADALVQLVEKGAVVSLAQPDCGAGIARGITVGWPAEQQLHQRLG